MPVYNKAGTIVNPRGTAMRLTHGRRYWMQGAYGLRLSCSLAADRHRLSVTVPQGSRLADHAATHLTFQSTVTQRLLYQNDLRDLL